MSAKLTLKDENESVDFIFNASTNPDFHLQDKTFKMSAPEKIEVRAADNFFAGKNLLRQEYGPRSVAFDVIVTGATQAILAQNISTIQRLLSRASSQTHLQGGAYNQDIEMTEGNDTGDQGVILQIRRGSDSLSNITSELTNSSTAVTGLYTMKVIQGDLEIQDNIFASADLTGGQKTTSLGASLSSGASTFDLNENYGGINLHAYIPSTGEEVIMTSNATPTGGNFRHNITRGANGTSAASASSSATVVILTGRYYKTCQISLSCEPFILGPSRIINVKNSPGFKANPAVGNSNINRAFISAASVPGDVEALTRISTQLTGAAGIVIARDAGASVLNCPSFPSAATLSGQYDVFVFGQILSTSNLNMKLKINTSPTRFSVSDDGGSSYGATTNITSTWTPYQLIAAGPTSYNAYAMFGSVSGYTNGQVHSFSSNQAYLGSDSSVNVYSNRANLMSDVGVGFASYDVNIPPGCRSRYKVLASVNTAISFEYKLQVNFLIRAGVNDVVGTTPQNYEWTGPYTGERLIDFGVIDLSSMSVPMMSHPYSMSQILITLVARSVDEILGEEGTIQCTDLYLIPCQDEYAYLQAAWKSDGGGHEVYSNYDASFPYVGEETANMFDGSGLTGRIGTTLDATYGGNVITLVPNIAQTILFIPLLSVSSDWRAASVTSGSTGDTYMAIRPRYLHLPS